jgi:hypothetical protein
MNATIKHLIDSFATIETIKESISTTKEQEQTLASKYIVIASILLSIGITISIGTLMSVTIGAAIFSKFSLLEGIIAGTLASFVSYPCAASIVSPFFFFFAPKFSSSFFAFSKQNSINKEQLLKIEQDLLTSLALAQTQKNILAYFYTLEQYKMNDTIKNAFIEKLQVAFIEKNYVYAYHFLKHHLIDIIGKEDKKMQLKSYQESIGLTVCGHVNKNIQFKHEEDYQKEKIINAL